MKFKELKNYEKVLKDASSQLNVNPKDLAGFMEKLKKEIEEVEEELEDIEKRREQI